MLPTSERPNVALVDAGCADATTSYQYISEYWGIPTLLVVSQRGNDWENVKSIEADGYLLDTVRNGELMARLNAVVRRVAAGLGRRAKV